MNSASLCVIIPTYNNSKILSVVLDKVVEQGLPVIVVNDGSTDTTSDILNNYKNRLKKVIEYTKNKGKGHALQIGFKEAINIGYDYAITIDSDNQHEVDDIRFFLKALNESKKKDVLILGVRLFDKPNMPKSSIFANKFSNFWFQLQTWQKVWDTQCGFRMYPLHEIAKITLMTSRYESELELLVRLAWRNVPILQIPISVYYPKKEERLSHFRPFRDFTRISILNTFLCGLALLALPRLLLYKIMAQWKRK